MRDLQEFLDVVCVALVIIGVSICVTLSWMSTYVRELPIVTTAVVVFQQGISGSQNPQPAEESTQNISTSSTVQGENMAGACEPNTNLDSHTSTENGPILRATNSDKDIENNKDSSPNVKDSVPVADAVLLPSSGKESKPISEDESCSSASSLLRQRKKDNTSTEGSNKETVNVSAVNGTSVEAQAEMQYEVSPDSIRIKLRFLDDTQKLVRGQLTDEVGNFKRANFNSELSCNSAVRLIFNGQLLNRDHSTLGQYGLFDNCVVHCHVSPPQPSNSNERNSSSFSQDSGGLDVSQFLNPMLVLILVFLWYLRYEYPHIFNCSATFILICLTLLLFFSQHALSLSLNISLGIENGNNSGNNAAATATATTTTTTISISTPESNVTEPRIEPNNVSSASSTPSTPPNSTLEENSTMDRPLLNTCTEREALNSANNLGTQSFSNLSLSPREETGTSFTRVNQTANADGILLNS